MTINTAKVSVTQVISNQEIKIEFEGILDFHKDEHKEPKLQECIDQLYVRCLESLTSIADKIVKK